MVVISINRRHTNIRESHFSHTEFNSQINWEEEKKKGSIGNFPTTSIDREGEFNISTWRMEKLKKEKSSSKSQRAMNGLLLNSWVLSSWLNLGTLSSSVLLPLYNNPLNFNPHQSLQWQNVRNNLHNYNKLHLTSQHAPTTLLRQQASAPLFLLSRIILLWFFTTARPEFRIISNSFNNFGQGSLTIENFGFVYLGFSLCLLKCARRDTM